MTTTPNRLSESLKPHLADMRKRLFLSEKAVLSPLEMLNAFSRTVDDALKGVFSEALNKDPDFCLVALGGYGRQELWPYSDVDILILYREGQNAEKLSRIVRNFWNLGLSLGTVARTLEECRSILGEDVATDTALLEARYLGGNRHLFDSLRHKCVGPYFEKNTKRYVDELSAALREGLFSSENSLYRVEPDLKNGICTLRDCQRLLWAERAKHGQASLKTLHAQSGFSVVETRRLEVGYAFLAGLRAALHIAAGQRLDVLETQYQQAIAERVLSDGRDAGDLLEAFFKTVRGIRLSLLSFLEKDLSGKSIWRHVRRRMSSVDIGGGVALLDGIFFPQNAKTFRVERPETVLGIFQKALLCQATLSVELRNKIRGGLQSLPSADFKSKPANDTFLSILSWPGRIGQTMLLMHETGILSKMIPPFSGLTCKVEYDSYHEFTVDQHSLLALCACDDLESDPDEKVSSLYKNLKTKMILRLAVLLHDIGKAMAGDHAQNGAVVAEGVAERLGLSDDRIRQIRFLVDHHLDLSNLSLSRDFDDLDLTPFTAEIGQIEILNLLYLLTIVDIRSVGHNTWTGWKAYQLDQLYDRLAGTLNLRIEASESSRMIFKPETNVGILTDQQENRLPSREAIDDILFEQELFIGFERLTVRALDRVGFLSDIIGCMTSEGYNILSAKILSTTDGHVWDVFHLEAPKRPKLSAQKRLDNIRRKWRLLVDGRSDADTLVRERLKHYPLVAVRTKTGKPYIAVRINNRAASKATVVEIETDDNFGLVHRIAGCFYECNLNVISAKLSTRSDQACDVFYVTDAQGKKITGENDRARLVERLESRLSRGRLSGD